MHQRHFHVVEPLTVHEQLHQARRIARPLEASGQTFTREVVGARAEHCLIGVIGVEDRPIGYPNDRHAHRRAFGQSLREVETARDIRLAA